MGHMEVDTDVGTVNVETAHCASCDKEFPADDGYHAVVTTEWEEEDWSFWLGLKIHYDEARYSKHRLCEECVGSGDVSHPEVKRRVRRFSDLDLVELAMFGTIFMCFGAMLVLLMIPFIV